MSDVGENGRITARQLYRAVDDAKEILEQKIDALKDDIDQLRLDMVHIRNRLESGPKWFGGRFTRLVDSVIYLIPVVAGGVLVYFVTH